MSSEISKTGILKSEENGPGMNAAIRSFVRSAELLQSNDCLVHF